MCSKAWRATSVWLQLFIARLPPPASRVRRSCGLRDTLAVAPGFLAHACVTEVVKFSLMGPKLRHTAVCVLSCVVEQTALKLGQHEDADEWCQRALFLDDKCVKALFRRALVRKATLNFAGAVADLQAALRLEPTNADLKKELRQCEVCARCSLSRGHDFKCLLLLRGVCFCAVISCIIC
jgi:hypothetical protein